MKTDDYSRAKAPATSFGRRPEKIFAPLTLHSAIDTNSLNKF